MIAETIIVDKWTYLIGIGVLLAVWVILYALRHDLHRRMLTVSLLLVPLAPLGQFLFLQDYWRPPILLPIVWHGQVFGGAADLLFSFVMGGLATAAYPVLLNKHPVMGEVERKRWLALSFVVIQALAVVCLTGIFHVNSIFASSAGFVAAGL